MDKVFVIIIIKSIIKTNTYQTLKKNNYELIQRRTILYLYYGFELWALMDLFLENSTKKISHYFSKLRMRPYLWVLKRLPSCFDSFELKTLSQLGMSECDATFLEGLNYIWRSKLMAKVINTNLVKEHHEKWMIN